MWEGPNDRVGTGRSLKILFCNRLRMWKIASSMYLKAGIFMMKKKKNFQNQKAVRNLNNSF